MDIWEILKIIVNMAGVVAIPVVLAFIGNRFAKSIKEREIQGKFVELAINILNQQPTKENANIREWATKVIDKYSGVPFTKQTQEDLIKKLPLHIREIYKDVELPVTSEGPLRIEKDILRGEDVEYELSPNTSGKDPLETFKAIVIHSTASLSITANVKWLTNDQSKASCHLMIDRDGSIIQLVPFNYIAWHAGQSHYKGLTGFNKFSIGIQLVNGLKLEKTAEGKYYVLADRTEVPETEVMKAKHKNETTETYWHKYSPQQIDTTKIICKLLFSTYNIELILGHDDIMPNKKIDPGPLFPLQELQTSVLGKVFE